MAVITLTGPSAAGKSTIEAELRKLGAGVAISHTTRLPRAGEKNGEHYHFVTDYEYDLLKSEGTFIETIELGTRRYAMSSAALLAAQKAAKHVVIVVEPHGAGQILEFCGRNGIRTCAVWLDCNVKEQARRWLGRVMADMVVGDAALAAHTERLSLMLGREIEWREDAERGIVDTGATLHRRYDLQIHETANRTPNAWAIEILNFADMLRGGISMVIDTMLPAANDPKMVDKA